MKSLIGAMVTLLISTHCIAAGITPAMQAKLDATVKEVVALASEPILINAAKACGGAKSGDLASMTQEKWVVASVLENTVRALTKNAAAEHIKEHRSDAMSEAFLNCADGTKAAFLAKPTNWSHKGKPKHEVPMTGKQWQGPVEVDESTGVEQVQIAVPVNDGGKPVGSLVVGVNLGKFGS